MKNTGKRQQALEAKLQSASAINLRVSRQVADFFQSVMVVGFTLHNYSMSFRDRFASLSPRRSLRSRLGLATAGILLLLSLLLSWLVGHATSEQLKKASGQSLAELAYQMVDKLDRGMFERYREMQILSELPLLHDPNYSQTSKRTLLEQLQRTYPYNAWIGLTDAQGKVLASTGGILEGKSVAARPIFQQGLQGLFVGDVHDAVILAQLLPNPDGEPLRFLDLSAPVKDDQGRVQGVIATHLSWKWTEEVQSSLLEPMEQHRQTEFFVLNAEGKVLLGPSGLQGKTLTLPSVQAARANENRYVMETWPDEGNFVTGFAASQGYREYPGLGWLVLVRQKADLALAPAHLLQNQVLGLGATLGIGFALLSWLSASRIVNPLLKIAGVANRIRQGDHSAEIPLISGQDEISRLSYSLHYLVTSLDSQQEALRQSEERYRLLAEALPQLIWQLDTAGQIKYCNQHWCIYTGLTVEQTLQLGWEAVLHPDDRALTWQQWQQATQTGQNYESEYRLRGADGQYRWCLASIGPAHDRTGQIVAWVGTAVDVEDRKQIEAQRVELFRQEQEAREIAETANRLKDEFLAVLSHELRSPLTPILGWVQMLRGHPVDENTLNKALATIERNANLQVQLVEDLLDISRILQGKLSLVISSVNLTTVISAALETVCLAAQAKSIEIHTQFEDQALSVAGDPNRLQQVVRNLLTNAVKFTPQGGQIKIFLQAVDTQAQLQICDTGKGIHPNFLPYLFDSFRQEDSTTTRKFGGLGLGLAIVRQIVELHGGTINAESPGLGLGATFTLRLPMLESSIEHQPSKEIEATTSLEGVKVLVVDDDTDTRQLVTVILEKRHAKVIALASASEALNFLQHSQVDVLVSDIGMPETDGYTLLRQVKLLASKQGKQIPAIALTAYAGEIDQRRAVSAGFHLHLSKPIAPDELVMAIAILAGCEEP